MDFFKVCSADPDSGGPGLQCRHACKGACRAGLVSKVCSADPDSGAPGLQCRPAYHEACRAGLFKKVCSADPDSGGARPAVQACIP